MDRFIQKGKRRSSVQPCESSGSTTSIEKDAKEKPTLTQKKKIKTSDVWNHFKSSDDKKYAKCLICSKEYKTSGNTSNLRDHLNRFHPDLQSKPEFSEIILSAGDEMRGDDNIPSTSSSCRSSMRSVESYSQRAVLYDTDSRRKTDIDKALAEMVAKDLQPYSIVENEGFIQFCRVLDPRYKLPSRAHLRNVLMVDFFNETSAKLTMILKTVSNIAVTCDLWTSNANVHFMTVTSHFVYDFTMKTASLGTQKLKDPTNHTAQNIASTLQEILSSWKVLNKTVCVVTDNDSPILKACELLKIRNIPCFAHTLNLVVQDALKLDKDDFTKNLFTKCKTIVRFFKQTAIANEKFKAVQEHFAYTVLQETPTRWNSFYSMVQRLLQTNEAIATVLLSTTNAPMPLTVEEINVLKDIELLLELFSKVTDKISGGEYVTISLIIPMAFGLQRKVERLTPQTAAGTKLQKALLYSIGKRLSPYELQTATRMATILDPRFKKDGFQNTSNAEQAALLLENELVHLSADKSLTTPDEAVETKNEGTFFDFLDLRAATKNGNARSDAIIEQCQYLERPIVPQDMDPFLWIKVNQTEFPLMISLFFKYLCIPATSVESERVFSKAGQIVSERRARLTEENVNILLFLNQNFWVKNENKTF